MTTRNDLPFFKFSPGDWFKGDIRHCSPETKGVFVQLCAQMWIDGGKLSDDERLPAICGCDKQSFSNARAELDLWQILRYDDEGNIYISFISQQLHELSALREARAEAGRKGGNTKQLNRRSKAKAKSKQSSSIKNKEEEQEEDKENTPIVPKGTKNSRAKKIDRVKENTPTMKRIGSWFNRGETTLWSQHEADKLASVKPSPEELTLMESYYQLTGEKAKYRRKDVATLLNNWVGELDRARNATEAASQPRKKPKNTEFDLALNDILKACKQIEDTGRIAEYLESCWDKYKDIPKQGGVNVIQRAKEML